MSTSTRFLSSLFQRTKFSALTILFFITTQKISAQAFSPNIFNNWNNTTQLFANLPVAPGLTFSQVSRGSGLTAPAPVTSGITSSGWDGPTTVTAAEAANKFFTFSITSNATNAFSVTSMLLSLQRSTTGPGNFQMESSVNNGPFLPFGNPFSSSVNGTFTPTVTAATAVFVPAGQAVVFRLVGWNASGSTGTCRVNNNTAINGAVYTLTTTSVTGAPFCVSASSGASANVNYSSTGSYSGGNVFTAQLSDASGSFASPVNIGTLSGNAASGTIVSTIPAGTIAGTGYRVRVVSSVPAITGVDNGSNISIGGVTASTTVTNLTCNGSGNGAISSTVTSGASPFTYSWSTSATTSSINGLSAGSYTLIVTDNGGCAATLTATVTEPTAIVANPTTVDVLCNGGATGGINLSVSGGTSPYTFTWSNSSTTQNLSNITAGTYSVIITDNIGCGQNATITITEPSAINISASSSNENCNGDANGTANLTVSGGTSPYSFSWSNSATTQNISNLTIGTYSVIVTDNNGCGQNASVTITEPAVLAVSPSSTNVSCNGGNNGTANLIVSGGTAPYSYAWSNSTTTQNLSNLSAGTYSVIVTDNNGCAQNTSVTITEPAGMNISASSTNANCNGGNNGTANLTVSGGTSPYTFMWSNSATTQNISGLSAGTYSVIVTDNQGCSQNSSVTITAPSAINISATSTNINCNGGNNGTANLAVNGGTSPYSYAWSNSATTQNISSLTAGTYSVIVTDNQGCTQNTTVTITQPSTVSASTSSTNVNCNGGNNGTANLTVSGGISPYTFAWSNSATTQNISNLTAGTYSVIITDNNGCSQNSSVTITQPTAVSVSASSTNVNCNGGNNGTANLTVSGGTSPYSYAWSNSATTQNISNLSAGTYSVIVMDNNACTQTATVTITAPSAINISSTSTNVNCNGGNTGTTSLTVSGGTSPYSYAWSNSATTQNISGLSAGTYSVIVTDNQGCTQNTTVTITQPSAISVSPSSTNVNCNGGNTGTANLTVNGGTSPYSYSWSNSATTQNISNLSAGTYSVIVTDNHGCTQNSTVTITQPSAISVSPSSTDVNCNGGNTGTANLTVSGGTSPYSYSWSNSATTQNISNLSAGTYSVMVTDNNGCSQNTSVTITEPSPITISPSSTNVNCNGGNDGTANLTVTGGTSPYSFAWSNSQTTQNISNLPAGTYSVIMTDNNGCSQNNSVTITMPAPIISSSIVLDASCSTCSDGNINLTASGGTTPYTYAWSNSASTEDISALVTGMYYVTITDANGCQHTDSAFVDFSTGIASVNVTNKISVYPNPSDGENIHIVFTGQQAVSSTITFHVYDLGGKEIYRAELNGNGGEYQTSAILANGTYLYRIEDQGTFIQSGPLVILK